MTTETDFNLPTQYRIDAVFIDGEDIIGLFQSVEIYESIYSTGITGSIVIVDSDFAGFIEESQIRFDETISFVFTNALGEELKFDGFLCGLRNEVVKQKIKIYTIDFVSQAIRNDDEIFLVKRYTDTPPQDIINECVDDLLRVRTSQE